MNLSRWYPVLIWMRSGAKDKKLAVVLKDGSETTLKQPEWLAGYTGDAENPASLLFRQNYMHIDLQFDKNDPISKDDPAGIRDIILEAATTTILDCEDAVAAVDAEDKVVIYRNLLGVLVKGDLQESVAKNGTTFVRRLSKDREYQSVNGEKFTLPGRSLLFVRNVGLLMNNPAILDEDENDIFEGILDCRRHDTDRQARSGKQDQFESRFHLYRQTETAWPERNGFHKRTVQQG